MICEECKIEINLETPKPSIWGVQTVFPAGRMITNYFCSEQHGNEWMKNQLGTLLCLREVLDEAS